MKKISVIIPMYYEEEVVQECYNKMTQVLSNIKDYEYEIICVNDGSKDKTLSILEKIAENDKKWEQYAEDTLECAGILYKSIEQHINNKDISKKMQCRVRDLTMAYAKEWEQTVSDYYKLGVVDGFKNRNKLNDIL